MSATKHLLACLLFVLCVTTIVCKAQRQCLNGTFKRADYLSDVAVADRPAITLHRLPWATSTIETYIIQSIISEVMGYSVSLYVDYDYSGATMINKLASGEADFAADVWATSMPQQQAQAYVKQGLIVQQNQGYNPKTGLYVPTFLVQQYPQLYLGFWQVYSNPTTVATVFNNTLHNFAAEKGWDGDWVCPDSFGCKNGTYYASKCNASAPGGLAPSSCVPVLMMGPYETSAWSFQVTENLGLYFVNVFVSSGNVDNLIQQYIAQQTPFLVFYSEPSPAISKHKLTRVQFPEPYYDCTSQFQYVNPKGPVDCDTAPVQSLTLKSGSLKSKSYFVDQFLTNYKMTENDIVYLGLNYAGIAYGGTGTWEDAACAWVQNRSATWQAWLPSVSASIQAGDCPGINADTINSYPADIQAAYVKYCFKHYDRSEALMTSVKVICTVAVAGLALIAAGVFFYRTHPVIMASSPIFSIIMVIGAIGGQITIWLLSQNPTEAVCNSRVVVGHLSFVLLFWTLFAKTHRLSKIFKSSTIKIVRYSNQKLLAHLGVAVAVISIYIIVWLAVDPATPTEVFSGNSIYNECRHSSNLWNYAMFLVHALAVVWGVSLCVQIRDLPTDFNEAKYIAFSLYHVAIIAGVVVAMVLFVLTDPNLVFAIESIAIFFLATSTILTLFVPKYLKIIGKLSLTEAASAEGSNASSLGTPKAGSGIGPAGSTTPRSAKAYSKQPALSSAGRPETPRLQIRSSNPRVLPTGASNSANAAPSAPPALSLPDPDVKAEVMVAIDIGSDKPRSDSSV